MTISWRPTLAALQTAISGVPDITVTANGSGYTAPPSVSLDAPSQGGVQATAIAEMGVGGISVTGGGVGYSKVPNIVLAGGNGVGCTAVANLTPFTLGSVKVTHAGTGYTSPPTVQFSGGGGQGAAGVAVLSGGVITAINVTNGGSGYSTAPTVELTGGGGLGAVATAIVTSVSGSITSVALGTGGTYTTAPAVSAGIGSGLNVSAILNGAVSGITTNSVQITYPGSPVTSGYSASSTPNIAIDPPDQPGGVQATATAIVPAAPASSGAITIVITNAGSGYSFVPGAYMDAPDVPGTGANQAVPVASIVGPVADLVLIDGGTGYPSSGSLVFSPSGATGTFVVSTNTIKSVYVTAGGTGYSSPPSVSFIPTSGGGSGGTATAAVTPVGVASVQITNPGQGYGTPYVGNVPTPPTVVFLGGGGNGAQATATLTPTTVGSITVTDPGTGYVSPPTATIVGGGGLGATLSTSLELVAVNVLNGGYEYPTVPSVTIANVDGNGNGAAATANLSNANVNGDTFSINEAIATANELLAIGTEYDAGLVLPPSQQAKTYVMPTSVNWSEVDKITRFAASVSSAWFTWPASWAVAPSTDPVLVMMRANLFNTSLAAYVGVPDPIIASTFAPLFALAVPAYTFYVNSQYTTTATATVPYQDNSPLGVQLSALVATASELTTYLNTP